MTSYTPNRDYPFPSSNREAARGGTHSEALARAVAADLDVLDAGWAAELTKPTVMIALSADQTGYTPNNETPILFTTTEKSTGVGIIAGQTITVSTLGQGWYHVTGCTCAGASGTITANARHRLSLAVYKFQYGNQVDVDVRYSETYQAGSQDCYNTLDSIMYLAPGLTLTARYLHSNTGSNVTVKTGMTRLCATRLFGA
jgi:hypothetical protein